MALSAGGARPAAPAALPAGTIREKNETAGPACLPVGRAIFSLVNLLMDNLVFAVGRRSSMDIL